MTYYVYTYREPPPSTCIFYVGKGQRRRSLAHFSRNDKHPFTQKIQKMLRGGKPPIVDQWPANSEDHAYEMEKRLVALLELKCSGAGSLLNLCDGGRGGVSSALRGVKKTAQHAANISRGRKGIKPSLEAVVKMIAAQKKRVAEHPDAMAAMRSCIKLEVSKETRAKRAAAGRKLKGKKKSLEHRAALRIAQQKRLQKFGPARPKGFSVSDQVKQKISASLIGRKQDPQIVAKRTATLRKPELRAANSARAKVQRRRSGKSGRQHFG